MKKMYSAFLSSVYESLLDEREVVINTMLDFRVFPICMEHFTVAANRRFEDIKGYIDESDFLILLLGVEYGSVADDGKSWTEHEYLYAREKGNIDILAIIMPDLCKIIDGNESAELTESQRKQVEFAENIMAVRVKNVEEIKSKLTMFFSQRQLSEEKYSGWVRGQSRDEIDAIESDAFAANESLNISGVWHHVHLCNSNDKYIRIGTMNIQQKFDGNNGWNVYIRAHNYAAVYDEREDELSECEGRYTEWSGSYYLGLNGVFQTGIYSASKVDTDEFGGKTVRPGTRKGLHDFQLVAGKKYFLRGSFHDAVSDDPSNGGKAGCIYVFRNEQDRFAFLKKFYMSVLKNNSCLN